MLNFAARKQNSAKKKNPLGEQRIDAKAEAAAGACIEAVYLAL